MYFIHLISDIYIAPLQVELLRCAPDSSAAEKSSFEMREEGGRKGPVEETKGLRSQVEGPTTEKTRHCLVEVWANETRRRPCSGEHRDREPLVLVVS